MPNHKRVLKRFKCCYYCGAPPENLDHVFPKSRGGVGKGNVTGSCIECNQTKGGRTLEEFREFLQEERNAHVKALGPYLTPNELTHALEPVTFYGEREHQPLFAYYDKNPTAGGKLHKVYYKGPNNGTDGDEREYRASA